MSRFSKKDRVQSATETDGLRSEDALRAETDQLTAESRPAAHPLQSSLATEDFSFERHHIASDRQKSPATNRKDLEQTEHSELDGPIVFATNGMMQDERTIERFFDDVQELAASTVNEISNETRGFVRDLTDSILSSLNSKIGEKLKKPVVAKHVEELWNRLQEGQDITLTSDELGNTYASLERPTTGPQTIVNYAFSQGAINTANALFIIRDRFLKEPGGKERWEEAAKKIRVFSFGAGGHVWPKGVKVHSYAHEQDYVPKVTHLSNFVTGLWRGAYKGDAQIVRPVVIRNETGLPSHGIRAYQENFPKFLVAEFKDKPEELARELAESMDSGVHPPEMYQKIIKEALNPYKDFLQTDPGSLVRSTYAQAQMGFWPQRFANALLESMDKPQVSKIASPFMDELTEKREELLGHRKKVLRAAAA